MPTCESVNLEAISEWMGNDEEEFTDADIVKMLTNEANGPDNNNNKGN